MQNVKFSLLVIKLKQYFPCMQIWLSLLKCRGLTGKCIKHTIYVDAYEQCEKNIYSYASFQNLGTMAQTSLLLRLIQGILFFWIDPIPDMALLTVQYTPSTHKIGNLTSQHIPSPLPLFIRYIVLSSCHVFLSSFRSSILVMNSCINPIFTFVFLTIHQSVNICTYRNANYFVTCQSGARRC